MEQTTFRTKDLGEASALLCSRIPLQTVETVDDKCWFVFVPFDQATAVIDQYWQHKLTVDAQDYFHALNRLKQLVFERK